MLERFANQILNRRVRTQILPGTLGSALGHRDLAAKRFERRDRLSIRGGPRTRRNGCAV